MPCEKALSIISLLAITIVIAMHFRTTKAYLQQLGREKYHQEEMENDATIIQQNEEMLKIQQKAIRSYRKRA